MKAWTAEHAHALAVAFAKFKANPFGSLFSALAIGIMLSLPAILYAASLSVERWSGGQADASRLSILLDDDAGESEFSEVAEKLRTHPQVSRVEAQPKADALQALEHKLRLENVVAALGENPLPDGFVVHAKSEEIEALTELRDEIVQWPAVSEVIWDAQWVRKLQAIVRFGQSLAWVLAALLGIGVLAITFNTVRLQVLTQRTEIEVSSLIGATRAFVRRPFLYFGALQGVVAGLACCATVAAVIHVLQREVEPINSLYESAFVLALPSLRDAVLLVAVAAALGWLGALISLGQHLGNPASSR
jgi:cell division transport system permease protein